MIAALRQLWSMVSRPATLEDGTQALQRQAGMGPAAPSPAEKSALESLRNGMLELASAAEGFPGVRMRRQIEQAADLQALWFMRSTLAAALAPIDGEDRALRRIEAISDPVRSRLPRSLQGSGLRRPSIH